MEEMNVYSEVELFDYINEGDEGPVCMHIQNLGHLRSLISLVAAENGRRVLSKEPPIALYIQPFEHE